MLKPYRDCPCACCRAGTDDWVVLEQERWDQLRLHALEATAEVLLCRGQHMLALEASLVAARSELFRESAHRVIIRVYLAEGNWELRYSITRTISEYSAAS